MKVYFPVFLFLFLSFCCSCVEQIRTKSNQNKIARTIEELYNQEFILPDTLTVLHLGQKENIYSKTHLECPVKIVTILNTDCRNCTISELIYWDSFKQELEHAEGLMILVVVLGENEYVENVLIPELNINIPVVLDIKKEFLKNSFLSNDMFNTVLVDDENKVILIGNSANNIEVEDLLVTEINKRLNPNFDFR